MSTSTVTTPSRARHPALVWIAIATGVVVVAVTMAVISGIATLPARGLLDPEAAGPEGSRALARILEDNGRDIVVVTDRRAAFSALGAGDATLVWADTSPLSDETLNDVSSRASDVVLLAPRSRDLRVLLVGSESGGYGEVLVDPGCDLPEAGRAGAIRPGALFVPTTTVGAVTSCYPDGDGFGMLMREADGQRITAVDAAALFTNQHLSDDGNAALAVNLLGRQVRIVWYLPSLADSDFADTSPTLGDLTPPWVTPAIVLLIVATAAAAVWRGRRFGPLVAERMPVTVRAEETTEGRARLYARAGDPTHAADQLRIAALRRSARRLGLGPAASATDISDAVATRLGEDRAAVRALLIDDTLQTDAQLVDTAERLDALERRLGSVLTVRPERNAHE